LIKAAFEQSELSVVIPCLNEHGTLAASIASARDLILAAGVPGEIVVADNGSTDGSPEIARRMGAQVVDVSLRGYGAALIYGCRAAAGRWIVMGDADGSYDFCEALPMLEKLRDGADLVVGTRLKGRILPGAMPWKNRYLGNPALTGLLNLLFRSGLSDAHCGLRAFTRSAFERMDLRCTGMEFASEMIVKATLLDMRREETPITYAPDGRQRPSHLRPWRDGWRHMRFLLLYSPGWVYLVPGLAMFLIGFVLNTVLSLLPETTYLWLGSLFFGTHWTVPATLSAVFGMQVAFLGVISSTYGVQRGLFPPPDWQAWITRRISMEVGLLVGLGLVLIGGIVEAQIALGWVRSGFGTLGELRPAVYGLMWIMLGVEWMFNSFILGLLYQALETIPDERGNQRQDDEEVEALGRRRLVRSEMK
jgi:glycosyltransferase involved in cell wall biosynthesis